MSDDIPRTSDPSTEQADDALLGQLRALATQLDGVPDQAILAARSQFAYANLDAELAALVYDSVSDPEPAGMRSETSTARRLTFEAGSMVIEVEILGDGDRRRLIGQCVPGAEVALTVRCRPAPGPGIDDDPVVVLSTSDDLGRFDVEVPAGELQLRGVWHQAQLAVETDWVSA